MSESTWGVVLPFLPAEHVADAKSVSKIFRSTARTVLTRGRFKHHTRCAKVMSAWAPNEELVVSDADRACFRLAWASDPGLAAAEAASTLSDRKIWDLRAKSKDLPLEILFDVVEPSLDGLERIVAGMEHAEGTGFACFFEWGFWSWVDKRTNDEDEADSCVTRVWRAVERWRDPRHAFGAVYPLVEVDDSHEGYALQMTADWTDSARRKGIVAAFAEIDQNLQGQMDRDWEQEHGWKYCPHGEKFWDCPECAPDDGSDRDGSGSDSE